MKVVLLCLLLAWCADNIVHADTSDNNHGYHQSSVNTVEGDLLLTPQQLTAYLSHVAESLDGARLQRAVVEELDRKWPNGVVPYDLSPELSIRALNVIMAAINQYMRDTCIKFKKREPLDRDFIHFYPGIGCLSYVGRVGGQQNISIGSQCEYQGVVIHEIFHALGRWHEHSRPDRDNYIQINTANIAPEKVSNFHSVSNLLATTQNIAYDYDSIMHYDAFAFSQNNKTTIQPLNESIPLSRLGQRNSLSEHDIRHIQALYCTGAASEWSSWGEWSTCSRSCGLGQRQRLRNCLGTGNCTGNAVSFISCNNHDCAAEPVWGQWSSWSGCSRTCGKGQRTRVRMCMTGDDCDGKKQEFSECATQDCLLWSAWGRWSLCSRSCEGGVAIRRRNCLKNDGSEAIPSKCIGPEKEHYHCNMNITCTDEKKWSTCTHACGGGTQIRHTSAGKVLNRTCNKQPCLPVSCLSGLAHVGCYKLVTFQSAVHPTNVTSNYHSNQTDYVRLCAEEAIQRDYRLFAVGPGACYTGSNNLSDYTAGGMCPEGGSGDHVVNVYSTNDKLSVLCSSDCNECSGAVRCAPCSLSALLALFLSYVFMYR